MKFYHGTNNPNLKELTIDHYMGKLYVTDSYKMALMYAACPLRNWNYNKEKDLLILNEVNENAFNIMYKGKVCYIYTCEVEDAIKDETNISNHTYIVKHNVTLNKEKEVILDAYERILELEKTGQIKLNRWENYSDEAKKINKERTINHWKPYMQNELENFPYEYELLIKIFPELEIKRR